MTTADGLGAEVQQDFTILVTNVTMSIPSIFISVALQPKTINLSWQGNEAPVNFDHYTVQRDTGAGFSDLIGNLPFGPVDIVIDLLSTDFNNTSFRVEARDVNDNAVFATSPRALMAMI